MGKVWNSGKGFHWKDYLNINFKTRFQWQQAIPQMNQLKGTTERKSSAAQVSRPTCNMVCLQYPLEKSNKNLRTNTIDCRCRKCYLVGVFKLQLTIIKIGKKVKWRLEVLGFIWDSPCTKHASERQEQKICKMRCKLQKTYYFSCVIIIFDSIFSKGTLQLQDWWQLRIPGQLQQWSSLCGKWWQWTDKYALEHLVNIIPSSFIFKVFSFKNIVNLGCILISLLEFFQFSTLQLSAVCIQHWHHLAVVFTIQRIFQYPARWCLYCF